MRETRRKTSAPWSGRDCYEKRAGRGLGLGPGSPPGAGPITVPGSGRRPGEVRLRGGAGRPVRAPSLDSTDLLHIGFSPPPTGGGSRAEAMTSSQRPEVVECKKLPTCDRKKKERERERRERRKKKNFVASTEHARLPIPLPPGFHSRGSYGAELFALRLCGSGSSLVRAPGFKMPERRKEAGVGDSHTSGSRLVPSLLPNPWIKNLGGGRRRKSEDGELRLRPEGDSGSEDQLPPHRGVGG